MIGAAIYKVVDNIQTLNVQLGNAGYIHTVGYDNSLVSTLSLGHIHHILAGVDTLVSQPFGTCGVSQVGVGRAGFAPGTGDGEAADLRYGAVGIFIA